MANFFLNIPARDELDSDIASQETDTALICDLIDRFEDSTNSADKYRYRELLQEHLDNYAGRSFLSIDLKMALNAARRSLYYA